MSSFDQVIRNILADIFGEEEQQEVTRPRARPEGLMSSTRPQSRPEDVEPVQPSASESTSKFVAAMGDYDDTTEQGVEIPLAFFKGTARDLEGRYKTTGMQLAKLNRDTEGSTVKVSSVEEDTTVDDLLSEVQAAISKPSYQRAAGRGFKMSVSDIQTHLKARGYDTGDIDGRMGPKTRAAIKSFQRDNDLVADGIVGKNTQTALQGLEPLTAITTQELESAPMNLSGVKTERERIQDILDRDDFVEVEPGFELGTPAITVSSNTKKTKEEKEDVQRALLELGYDVGEVDGVIGTKTRAAIRQFQKDNNLSADAVVGKNTAAAMNEALTTSRDYSIEDVKTASVIDSIPVPEKVKNGLKFVDKVTKAVLSPVGKNFINDMLFGGGYSALANPINQIPLVGSYVQSRQQTAGAEVFSEDALKLMKKLVLDARNEDGSDIFDKGSVSVGEEVYESGGLSVNQSEGGASAGEIIKSLADGSNPINEIKLMLGQFNAKIDENGDIVVTDRFDYNEIVNPIDGVKYKTAEYEQAIKDGKFTDADVLAKITRDVYDGEFNYKTIRSLAFVLGSRGYEDATRNRGRLFNINLGPATIRPKKRPGS